MSLKTDPGGVAGPKKLDYLGDSSLQLRRANARLEQTRPFKAASDVSHLPAGAGGLPLPFFIPVPYPFQAPKGCRTPLDRPKSARGASNMSANATKAFDIRRRLPRPSDQAQALPFWLNP